MRECLRIRRARIGPRTEKTARTMLLLGEVQYGNGDLQSASVMFQHTFDVMQEIDAQGELHATALNNLAYLLADDLNRPEEALPYIEEAVRLARDTGAVLDTHGWVLILVGRYREGIGILTRAIELDQNAAEYHLHAAEGYAREGIEMASAAKEFNRARELAEAQGDGDMVARVEERARELKVDLSVKSDDD